MPLTHQGPHFSAADFAKFRGAVCEIPLHCYPQIPYILQRVVVVVLTDSTSMYNKFTVTGRQIRFVHINIIHAHHVIHVIVLIIIMKELRFTRFYCFLNGKIKKEPEKR